VSNKNESEGVTCSEQIYIPSFPVMESHDNNNRNGNDIELHTIHAGNANAPFPGTLWYYETIKWALVAWLTQFFPIVLMNHINAEDWRQLMTTWWYNVDNQRIKQHFVNDLVDVAKQENYRFVHRSHRHDRPQEQQQPQQHESDVLESHEDAKTKSVTAKYVQRILQNDFHELIQRARDEHNNNIIVNNNMMMIINNNNNNRNRNNRSGDDNNDGDDDDDTVMP
jgi:hypothetical protein